MTLYDSRSSSRVKYDAGEDVVMNFVITRHILGRSRELKTVDKRHLFATLEYHRLEELLIDKVIPRNHISMRKFLQL